MGLSFSINVIELDQLAMQRGKDLVQVSLVIRGNKKRLTKFQHLIIWCALVQYASACSDNIPELEPLANICRWS